MLGLLERPTLQCRCGHDRQLHEHYRRGTDCALCGRSCTAFHEAGPRGVPAPVARLARALHRHR